MQCKISKSSILDVWRGSKCASKFAIVFCLIIFAEINWFQVFTSLLSIPPFWCFQMVQKEISDVNPFPHIFRIKNYSVEKVWTPPSIDPLRTPVWPSVSLYLFTNPPLLTTLFRQHRYNEIRDKHKGKPMRESCFFIFRRLQNNITFFLFKQHLNTLQQANLK